MIMIRLFRLEDSAKKGSCVSEFACFSWQDKVGTSVKKLNLTNNPGKMLMSIMRNVLMNINQNPHNVYVQPKCYGRKWG